MRVAGMQIGVRSAAVAAAGKVFGGGMDQLLFGPQGSDAAS
jgi:hypothetical protein